MPAMAKGSAHTLLWPSCCYVGLFTFWVKYGICFFRNEPTCQNAISAENYGYLAIIIELLFWGATRPVF